MDTKHSKLHLISRFSIGSRKYFAVAVIASLLATVFNMMTPQVFRFGVDSVLDSAENPWFASHLWVLALLLVLIAIASGASQFLFRASASRAGENFTKNMRDTLFTHVQKLPMSWHDKHQTGDIIQRCTSDVEVIRNFVVTQLPEVFRTVFLIAISFSMMMSMNRKLSLIVLLFVPVVIAYSAIFYRLIARRFIEADEAEGVLSTIVQENATGVRVVRAFGREKFEMDRFREKNDFFAKLWIRLGTLSGVYWGVGDFITGFQVVVIIALGAVEAVHGNITVGEFIAFASYNTSLVWPVRGLGRILSDMSKANVSFDRVDYILQAQEEDAAAADDTVRSVSDNITQASGADPVTENASQKSSANLLPEQFGITFDHVTFGYDKDNTVLSDVSFGIPQGSTFGILGGTGSGKSTAVQLLTRLYELPPENGTICLGDRDIRTLPLAWLRKEIGFVLQEPFLYSRTIRENIAAARPDATFNEIRAAAKIACVDDSIMNFADGYDTLVGERGVTLSGGQRQRIAIARMLLQDAPVMIFDDSLSAVDTQTDTAIRKALKASMEKATVILISHRITSLMSADKIMVLNRGQIDEMGTHQELLQKDGIYRRIYDIQMSQDDRMQMEVN